MIMKSKRKTKLIEPRLQWKCALLFLLIAMVSVLVETVVLGYTLSQVATGLPHDGDVLMTRLPDVISKSLVLTLCILVPLTLVTGIRASFRVIGPLYRFRVFLGQVRDGEESQPCRIRKEDELHDFCALLNEVTEPLRRESGAVGTHEDHRAA